jgi:hypothetical protein
MLIAPNGNQTLFAAGLGVFAGLWGIFHGLRAKEFVKHGHYGFSREAPEKYTPRWWERLFVLGISTWALIWSVLYLVKHWSSRA